MLLWALALCQTAQVWGVEKDLKCMRFTKASMIPEEGPEVKNLWLNDQDNEEKCEKSQKAGRIPEKK